jgi:sec-independent protein translocase protein TatC
MEHIEVFRWHLIRSLIAVLICSIVAFFYIDFIFDKIILGPANEHFISYKWLCAMGKFLHISVLCLPPLDIKFQSTELSGQFMMSFSSSFMIGFIVAFPYIFWEFWRFMKPALKKGELKHARGIVFWSSFLFFLGVLFAYFLIAPFTINFFTNYQLSPKFENIFTIDNYYSTLSDLILGLGLVFELPVLVYFLSKLGIISPSLLKKIRSYAYVVIMIVAAVITPPDWFSIFLVAIPLVILYEVSIIICGKIVKSKKKEEQLNW